MHILIPHNGNRDPQTLPFYDCIVYVTRQRVINNFVHSWIFTIVASPPCLLARSLACLLTYLRRDVFFKYWNCWIFKIQPTTLMNVFFKCWNCWIFKIQPTTCERIEDEIKRDYVAKEKNNNINNNIIK